MRTLALMFVAANLLLAIWGLTRPPAVRDEPPVVTASDRGVATLVLLGEVSDQDLEAASRRASAGAPLAPEGQATGSAVPRTAETDQAGSVPPGAELIGSATADSELSENGAQVTRAPAQCARVGPLASEDDAAAVMTRARSLGMDALLTPIEIASGTPDHQVHLPPLPSSDQALRVVRELDALGIEAYVIGGGSLSGAVSVGMFTDLGRAQARRDDVVRLGYDVRIREVRRTRRWFDVVLAGPDLALLESFTLALREDWPELLGERIDCPPPQGAAGA